MLVSIILCTHRNERYEDFVEAIDSLNAQSCDNEKLEIVVVVDGNRGLYGRIFKKYKTLKKQISKWIKMTRTLQNRYVVVTGDLKSSRKLKDRAEVQEELKNALRIFQGARRE